MLESRILLQGVLPSANTLPQSESYEDLVEDAELAKAYKKTRKALLPVLDELLNIRDLAIASNPSLSTAINAAVEDGIAPVSRKRKRGDSLSDYWAEIEGGMSRIAPYTDAVLTRWHDRVQLSSGKANVKRFKALNQGITAQVQMSMHDDKRTERKAHTKRSNFEVIGATPTAVKAGEVSMDFEIYDDSDFYHQLLKQLLQSGGKNAGVGGESAALRKFTTNLISQLLSAASFHLNQFTTLELYDNYKIKFENLSLSCDRLRINYLMTGRSVCMCVWKRVGFTTVCLCYTEVCYELKDHCCDLLTS